MFYDLVLRLSERPKALTAEVFGRPYGSPVQLSFDLLVIVAEA